MGIWSMFDLFVPTYVTICHVYQLTYDKAAVVILMTFGTLSRAYGHSLTCSCPHVMSLGV